MKKRTKWTIISSTLVALGMAVMGTWYYSTRPTPDEAATESVSADGITMESVLEDVTEAVKQTGMTTAGTEETIDSFSDSEATSRAKKAENMSVKISAKQEQVDDDEPSAIQTSADATVRKNEEKKTPEPSAAAERSTTSSAEKTTTARTTERTTEKATTSKVTERTTEKATTARTTEKNTERATECTTQKIEERTTERATTATAHKHTWDEVYKTVHHKAVYETVTEEAWDEKVKAGRHAFCKGCGMDLTIAYGTPDCEEAGNHISDCPGGYVVKTVYDTIHHDPVTYQECVKEAYDEEVFDHLVCTGCGATAKSWAEVK